MQSISRISRRIVPNCHLTRCLLTTSSKISNVTNNSEFCMNLVKEYDFDNYLIGLLLPREARRGFYAVRAFNCEISRIKDQVRGNAMTGTIRFQWWLDIIDNIYNLKNNNPNNDDIREDNFHYPHPGTDSPVVHELCYSVYRHNLTQRLFGRCIEAKKSDLNTRRPETFEEIETHIELSQSSILYLILEVLGVQNRNAEYIASHVGVSTGIMMLLKGTAFHANEGKYNLQ